MRRAPDDNKPETEVRRGEIHWADPVRDLAPNKRDVSPYSGFSCRFQSDSWLTDSGDGGNCQQKYPEVRIAGFVLLEIALGVDLNSPPNTGRWATLRYIQGSPSPEAASRLECTRQSLRSVGLGFRLPRRVQYQAGLY